MPSLPYMRLYVNPLLADTGELSEAEMGAYMRLLATMWKRDGRLPGDDESLRKIARCPKPSIWASRWRALERFFERDEAGFWINRKLTDERDHALGTSSKRAKAGHLGGVAKAEKIRKRETAAPFLGNSSEPNGLKTQDSDVADGERRARVQTQKPDIKAPSPSEKQLAADDWPEGGLNASIQKLEAISSGRLDMSKQPGLAGGRGQVHQWKTLGYSFELDVVPVVEVLCKRSTEPIGTWAYFRGAIAKANTARTAAPDPSKSFATGDRHDQKFADKNDNVASAFAAGRRLAEREFND